MIRPTLHDASRPHKAGAGIRHIGDLNSVHIQLKYTSNTARALDLWGGAVSSRTRVSAVIRLQTHFMCI